MIRKLSVLVAVLCAIIWCPEKVRADISWLDKAHDCRSFQEGLDKFYGSLGSASVMTDEQQAELKQVLADACGPRFGSCQFKICTSTVPTQEAAADTPTTGAPSAIETDPLAWLKEPLKCPELLEQIRARYEPLGKFSQMAPEKKNELRHVLDVACSERFAHCSFASCAKLDKSDVDSQLKNIGDVSKSKEDSEIWPEARVQLDQKLSVLQKFQAAQAEQQKFLQLLKERQTAQIESKVAEERERGVEWVRFSVPIEREARKHPEEKKMKPLDSGNYGGFQSRSALPEVQRPSSKSPRSEDSEIDPMEEEDSAPPQKLY